MGKRNLPEVSHGHVADLVVAAVDGLGDAHGGRSRHLERCLVVEGDGGGWCGKVEEYRFESGFCRLWSNRAPRMTASVHRFV